MATSEQQEQPNEKLQEFLELIENVNQRISNAIYWLEVLRDLQRQRNAIWN